MADIGKVTPGSPITPRVPQEPHPGQGRHGEREDEPTDGAPREQPEQLPEECEDEDNDSGIDVYV